MKKARLFFQLLFLVIFFFVIAQGSMFIWLGLFMVSLFGAVFFGRFYCGYICPMNTVMGVTGKLSKKFKWQTKSVPRLLKTKWMPWLVLFVMGVTMMLSKKILHQELPLLIILMLLSVVVTLKYEEWVFHNHICPYGALLSLMAKKPRYATQVDRLDCIGCKKCESVCPSKAIQVDSETKIANINTSICHQCQACAVICPKDAINYTGGKK